MSANRAEASMTPAELFHRAGVALFGEQYVAPLAAALEVEKNTVAKWAAGKSHVPPGVWRDMWLLYLDRATIFETVGFELVAQIAAIAKEKARPPAR